MWSTTLHANREWREFLWVVSDAAPLSSGSGIRRLVRFVFPHPVHSLVRHGVRSQSWCVTSVHAQAGRNVFCSRIAHLDFTQFLLNCCLNLWLKFQFWAFALSSQSPFVYDVVKSDFVHEQVLSQLSCFTDLFWCIPLCFVHNTTLH